MVDNYPFGWTYVAVNVGAWLVAPVLLYIVTRHVLALHRRGMSRVRRTNVVDLDTARANRNVTVQGER